mgnify:CR=1 FL=1
MTDEDILKAEENMAMKEANYDWLKDEVHILYEEKEEYKKRINKAIEYIEDTFATYDEANNYRLTIDTDLQINIGDIAVLIDILKGENND